MSPLQTHTNTLGAAYPVQLAVFVGPLDFLLRLIEGDELDITEVSLVAVTDSYIQALERMDTIAPDALAEFLVVASRLLYLKSRSLLPKPPMDDPETDEEDPGDALIRQLLEYRRFKRVAEELRHRQEAGLRAFVRMAPAPSGERKIDLAHVHRDQLYDALQRALQRMPSEPPLPTLRTYAVTVAEQIEHVRRTLRRAEERSDRPPVIRFTTLLGIGRSRMAVIVTFLAVLELIKRREISFSQDELFGEILIHRALPRGGASAPPAPPD